MRDCGSQAASTESCLLLRCYKRIQPSAASFVDYIDEYGANGVKLDFKPYVVDGNAMVACLGADRM